MHGLVLALLVVPGSAPTRRLPSRRRRSCAVAGEEGHAPVPAQAPEFGWPPQGVETEAHASRHAGSSDRDRRAAAAVRTSLYFLILRFRLRVGKFVPAVYLKQVVENSDFRKYDDALRMVIDCTPDLADEIERQARRRRARGTVRLAYIAREAAMMTCFTPFPTQPRPCAFRRWGVGRYALAALALKSSWTGPHVEAARTRRRAFRSRPGGQARTP